MGIVLLTKQKNLSLVVPVDLMLGYSAELASQESLAGEGILGLMTLKIQTQVTELVAEAMPVLQEPPLAAAALLEVALLAIHQGAAVTVGEECPD